MALKKRIIPCLDIKDGRTVKGINFVDIRDAGDPIELAKIYANQGADELVFLDISATNEKRKTLTSLVSLIAKEINIPFTVGGGINSIEDVASVINTGADKISLNSAAVKNPKLITEVSAQYGSQCVVVAIDVKMQKGNWMVFVNGGKVETNLTALNWARQVVDLGAGEILLTSMNNDGTKNGFAIDITKQIVDAVSVPVIASGGAGKMEHFKEIFEKSGASGALAASVFHYGKIEIPQLKKYLQSEKIAVR